MSDYTPDNEAMERKRQALVGDVAALLDPADVRAAERLIDRFCRLSPPMKPPVLMHMIRLDAHGRSGGESRKPGNLSLNWKRLRNEFPDIVMNTAGALAVPWLIPFAALSMWNKLWTHSTIELRKEHATCLCAMWFSCDDKHKIDRDAALQESNELFRVYGWPPLTGRQFDSYMQDLIALDCIEDSDGRIWLREWIQSSY
jgi:hypothetical protein